MNAYENGVIKYAIDYERYKNGIAKEVIRLLDNANIEIAGYIKKTQSVATKARYKQIAKKLNEISKQLKERVKQDIDIDAVISYELKKENKLFEVIKKVLNKGDAGKISFIYPNVEQVKTSALFKPATNGLTFQSYLDNIEAGLFNTWDSAVRTGYLTGMNTKEIVRHVMGGVSQTDKLVQAGQIQPLRNAVYGNTRTLLQSFAEEARESVYRKNEEYFGDGEYKYEYLATLDARTCLVCGNYDGKKFKSLEDAPQVPQHRNCRCLIIPYFDIKDDTRASRDGQVDSKINFETWLEEQDEETQLEVLGATRFKMYQDGVKINQFVDNGEILTLDELEKKLGYDIKYEKNSYENSYELATKMFPNEKWENVYNNIYVAESRIPKEKNRLKIYNKELDMLKIASDNKHVSFMIPEISKGKNADSIIDGTITELKKIDGGESALSHRFRESLKQGKNVYLRMSSDTSVRRTKEIIRGVLLEKKRKGKDFDGLIYCYFDNNKKFYTWRMDSFYY